MCVLVFTITRIPLFIALIPAKNRKCSLYVIYNKMCCCPVTRSCPFQENDRNLLVQQPDAVIFLK